MAELRSFLMSTVKALTYPLRLKGGINVETITANKTMTIQSSHVQILNPSTASRDVTLPAVEDRTDGMAYLIRNSGTGGYNLVVKDTTPATICTIAQGQWSIVMCDAVGWRVAVAPGVSFLTLATDVITELTAAAGVTIDGLLLKDGFVVALDNQGVKFGTGADIVMTWDATDLAVTQAAADSQIKWGVSGAGINHIFYGDTVGSNLLWDQSNDQLLALDAAKIAIGSGAGGVGDIAFSWDGTRLNVTQLTADSEIRWGVDGAGIDQCWYGDTASTSLLWDQSADSLILNGVAKIKFQTIAAATGTAIPVTHSGSFPITQNGAETNTLADPTFIGQWLNIFVDTDTSGARVITAASRINQAGNVTITLTEVGDFIKLEAITIAGALKWQVVANDGAVLS